jgi:antitoxin MazE
MSAATNGGGINVLLARIVGGYTSAIRIEGHALITRIQKWGNSQGLRLSRQILRDVGLGVGDRVDVVRRDDSLVITPVRRVRGALALEDLVAEIPEGSRPGEVEWPPAGREVL